jgi:hypothetical protein
MARKAAPVKRKPKPKRKSVPQGKRRRPKFHRYVKQGKFPAEATILSDLSYALQEYGTYVYQDKGAWEVCNVADIAADMALGSPKQIADLMVELAEEYNMHTAPLVQSLIMAFDSAEDDVWDEIMSRDILAELY